MLSIGDVKQIHDILVQDFLHSKNPILPPGVKNEGLLDSAVSRQETSLNGLLKYPEPIANASTLLYGVCNNHPFHNGNKRTALVSMLVHLDKNKFTIFNTPQDELYDFMIKVADHKIIDISGKHSKVKSSKEQIINSDDEVNTITQWVKKRSASIKKGEKNITYRELRRILSSFSYNIEDHHRNMVSIVRYDSKKSFFRRKEIQKRTHIRNIPWPGDNCEVSINNIKNIREMCHLEECDGVDSDSFYNYTTIVDSFINKYRKVLKNLAKV
ncbi:MAG: type II toxin-antitoxin system death-on-curing family toxin [Burkholderiales bacterium]